MVKIAIVEDEHDLGNLVLNYLNKEGYECQLFTTGEEAFRHRYDDFHLWILDIMLPGSLSGYDLIKEIRKISPNIPVIFTSARDQSIDRIMGLELGSDDYLAKPYSIRELVLRVKKIVERCYKEQAFRNILKYANYTIDLDRRCVEKGEETIVLTSKEYDLLVFLVKNQNRALEREYIIQKVWGSDYFGSDRVVDDLLRRLRSKLPDLNVETIYGYGYRLL